MMAVVSGGGEEKDEAVDRVVVGGRWGVGTRSERGVPPSKY